METTKTKEYIEGFKKWCELNACFDNAWGLELCYSDYNKYLNNLVTKNN